MNPGGLLAVPGQVPVGSTGLRTHAPARPTGILLEVAGLVGSDLICLYYLNCGPLGWLGVILGMVETMLSLLAALISGP